jgi:hypothetical protein
VAKLHVLSASAFLIFTSCLAHGQDVGRCPTLLLPNQEVRVHDLPSLTAPSKDTTAVLATALEITFHDKALCCGKDSALEDAVLADPRSLQELGARLQGKHFLNDGQPIVVNVEYLPHASVTPGRIIGALLGQHAPLVEWKSHVYVLYGAIFDETSCYGAPEGYSIHKLLLLDPRFSEGRREVVFDRETDDWEKVTGMLIPVVAPQ